MNTFVIVLLILNLGLMAAFFFVTKCRFSQNKYVDNMNREVQKMITDIQLQTEACVSILEDKINQANTAIKEAEGRLALVQKELKNKEQEVVVLDKLMSKNTSKVKRDKAKKEEKIKIYTDNPLVQKNIFHDQILQMHKEGFSAEEISKSTGVTLGEVELTIAVN